VDRAAGRPRPAAGRVRVHRQARHREQDPGRGVYRTSTGANGDVVVGEQQLRALVATARTAEDYAHTLDNLLGAAWDAELEPYRHAGDGAPVTWLHQVG
jgi:hypothetical protein